MTCAGPSIDSSLLTKISDDPNLTLSRAKRIAGLLKLSVSF